MRVLDRKLGCKHALALVRRAEQAVLARNLPKDRRRSWLFMRELLYQGSPDGVHTRVRCRRREQGGQEQVQVSLGKQRSRAGRRKQGAARRSGRRKTVRKLYAEQQSLRVRSLQA